MVKLFWVLFYNKLQAKRVLCAMKNALKLGKYDILKQIDQPEQIRQSSADKNVDFTLAAGTSHKIPQKNPEFRIKSNKA